MASSFLTAGNDLDMPRHCNKDSWLLGEMPEERWQNKADIPALTLFPLFTRMDAARQMTTDAVAYMGTQLHLREYYNHYPSQV